MDYNGETETQPCVYVVGVREVGRYKIGHTRTWKTRRQTLQTGCPFVFDYIMLLPTDLPEDLEAFLHEELTGARLHGEWFELDQNDLNILADLKIYLEQAGQEKNYD